MKEFICACGSKKLIMISEVVSLVDFSRAGAIKDHPRLTNIGHGHAAERFKCNECDAPVAPPEAREMRKEVI